MVIGPVAEVKKGHYECRCGKTLAMEERGKTVGAEYCPIDPSGRHVYSYIYPNGCAATGSKHS